MMRARNATTTNTAPAMDVTAKTMLVVSLILLFAVSSTDSFTPWVISRTTKRCNGSCRPRMISTASYDGIVSASAPTKLAAAATGEDEDSISDNQSDAKTSTSNDDDDDQQGSSRVFEDLVEYPCDFKIKIVGANEDSFVEDMLAVVAESCNVVDANSIDHSTRVNGKWVSLTVSAPVESADMLYKLYENIDQDPRVKFKL